MRHRGRHPLATRAVGLNDLEEDPTVPLILFNICLRLAAMSCGAALIVAQVFMNMEAMGWSKATSGFGLAAIAMPMSMAVAVAVMEHSLRERRYASVGVTVLVLLCGIGHTGIMALERSAGMRDRATAAKVGANAGYHLAEKAHAVAIARVAELEAAETRPCRSAGSAACRAARERTSQARARADETQSKLAQTGAPVEIDGMAQRYGSAARIIDIVHPLALPLALELGGLVLIGFAFRPARTAPNVRKAAALEPPAKKDEAVEKVLALLEERNGRLPSVREVARLTGLPTTTAWRAVHRIRRAA